MLLGALVLQPRRRQRRCRLLWPMQLSPWSARRSGCWPRALAPGRLEAAAAAAAANPVL
jgi:hypothetical protein